MSRRAATVVRSDRSHAPQLFDDAGEHQARSGSTGSDGRRDAHVATDRRTSATAVRGASANVVGTQIREHGRQAVVTEDRRCDIGHHPVGESVATNSPCSLRRLRSSPRGPRTVARPDASTTARAPPRRLVRRGRPRSRPHAGTVPRLSITVAGATSVEITRSGRGRHSNNGPVAGTAPRRIEHHAERLALGRRDLGVAHGERLVVGTAVGRQPDDIACDKRSQPMPVGSSRRAGDPLARSVGGSDAAVEAHRRLERCECPAGSAVVQVRSEVTGDPDRADADQRLNARPARRRRSRRPPDTAGRDPRSRRHA